MDINFLLLSGKIMDINGQLSSLAKNLDKRSRIIKNQFLGFI